MRSATAAARRDDHQEPPPPLLGDRKHVRAVIRAIEDLRDADPESTCNLGVLGMRLLARELRVPYLLVVLIDAQYQTTDPHVTPADLAELAGWGGQSAAYDEGILDPSSPRWSEENLTEMRDFEHKCYARTTDKARSLRTLLAKCAASLRLA